MNGSLYKNICIKGVFYYFVCLMSRAHVRGIRHYGSPYGIAVKGHVVSYCYQTPSGRADLSDLVFFISF